jgi:predicted GTPase
MPSELSPIERFAILVSQTQELAARQASLPQGRIQQLQALAHRVRKIRDLGSAQSKKRVGVFGAPKRGKSTLLNTLLGEELLPTSPVPLSTTTIEIEQELGIENWILVIDHSSGFVERRECDSAKDVADLLEKYGSRRGNAAPAKRLRLKGSFPGCRILSMGGVLMDTPGAEVAFTPDAKLEEEARRAIGALDDTHVVLFCIRADQIGSRSDSDFYETHLRCLGPMHVVTMKDKWRDDFAMLADEVFTQYGLARTDPVFFSAVEAGDPSTRETSGIETLEQSIITELERLSPEQGLLPGLVDYALAVGDYPKIIPSRIHFLNLRHALERADSDWSQRALSEMSKDTTLWNP